MNASLPVGRRHHFNAAARARRNQRGAATLVVVMLLFFVVSLTAAYAARNLIFEQRISANQYRSSQAAEAAQAGLQWATAMLNGGRIDDACLPTTDPTQASFRQRYLLDAASGQPINPTTGDIGARLRPGAIPQEPQWTACQFNGSTWDCSCPTDALPTLTLPTGAGPYPAFGVRFVGPAVASGVSPSGVVRVEVNGCTSFDIDCITKLAPTTVTSVLSCRTAQCALLALGSAVRVMPQAALTAGAVMQAGGPSDGLTISNADPGSGVTVHARSTSSPPSNFVHRGPAGTPSDATLAYGDSQLPSQADAPDCDQCLFSAVFGMRPRDYLTQPSLQAIPCSSACSATEVNAAIALNPGRILHLKGGGGLNVASAIGTAALPVVLLVDGPVVLAAGAVITGFVYTSDNATLTAGEVRGAFVSAGTVTGNGSATVTYDPVVLDAVRYTQGSIVQVPGSWRDYP